MIIKRRVSGSVLLGHDVHSGSPIRVRFSDLATTGSHVLGAAGFGKSFLLRNVADSFIKARQPFGVLDPHGDLAQFVLYRLRRAGVRPRDIVVIDPRDPKYATGFNPLAATFGDSGEIAGFTLDAFAKAFGNASFDAAPRMEGLLRAVIRVLVDSKLSLIEGWDLLDVENVALRQLLSKNVSDQIVRQDLAQFDRLSRAEKMHVSESTRNRLRRVIQAAPVQMMLAQTQNTIDFHRLLEDGKYLIVNLAGVPPEVQRLLGALISNSILHAAKQRNPRSRRNWFLIADEFGEFATRDFANALDTLRKFGVSLIGAHQRLDQLSREDPDVLSAVSTNMRIKIAFGGLSRADAEATAREIFTGSVTGDCIKHELRQTKFRPVEGLFEVESESESDSESLSVNSGSTRSWGRGESDGKSETHWTYPGNPMYDDSEDPFPTAYSSSRQSSISESSSESSARGHTRSHTRSSSLVPITRHEEFSEVSSRTYYTLEEQWEIRVAQLHGLPKRVALVRVFNGPVHHIRTADVAQEVVDDRWHRYKRLVMERSPYSQPITEVKIQIANRRRELAQLAGAAQEEGRPFNVGSFRE